MRNARAVAPRPLRPGRFATNYGSATGLFAVIAHVVYGAVLGMVYGSV
jgi:hypothetical protein